MFGSGRGTWLGRGGSKSACSMGTGRASVCLMSSNKNWREERERVRGKKGGEGGDTDWETCMFHDRRVDGSHMTEEVEEALCFAIFAASAVAVIIVHFKIDSHGHVIDEVAKDVSPLRCVVASADGGADGNVFHYQKEKQNKSKKKNEQEDKPKKEKKKFIKIPD